MYKTLKIYCFFLTDGTLTTDKIWLPSGKNRKTDNTGSRLICTEARLMRNGQVCLLKSFEPRFRNMNEGVSSRKDSTNLYFAVAKVIFNI